MHVAHTALWVSDLEATKAFYEDGIGLEHTRDFTADGVGNYYVGNDEGGEIQFKHQDGPVEVEPSGIDHVALSVEDADETFERVVEATGCDIVLEPTTFEAANRRAAFVSDPDGYTVEFVAVVD